MKFRDIGLSLALLFFVSILGPLLHTFFKALVMIWTT